MSRDGKDSAEVVRFMAQFAQLKHWSDDMPEDLSELAANDSSVKDLCTNLWWAADFLKSKERRSPALFAAPVDPSFLVAWRDYEARYESVLSEIWLGDLFAGLGDDANPAVRTHEPAQALKADLAWDNADSEAEDQAQGIEQAIAFARFNVEQDHRWDESQDAFVKRIESGVEAWERLAEETGFNLQGILRRRALIPFVLIPRKVAAKHGSIEKLSMLKNLQQAHDAFVYGAAYAAVALMRSIMESVLRDHYGAVGNDLSERIGNVRGRLPRGANDAALHRLRRLANAILHLDPQKDEGLPTMDDVQLEKEIVRLLFVLRALIERVD